MAITKVLGTSAVLKIGGTGGAAIELVKGIDFAISQNEVDTTDNDSSGGWQEFLMGNRTGTCSFTYNWDSDLATSTDQQLPVSEIAEADGGDLQTWAYYPSGTGSGKRVYTFSAYIMEINHGAQNEAVQEITVTLRISGAITVTTA